MTASRGEFAAFHAAEKYDMSMSWRICQEKQRKKGVRPTQLTKYVAANKRNVGATGFTDLEAHSKCFEH